MDRIHVQVVSKSPPGGRCEIYDRFFFEVVKAYENVYYSLIPSNLYDGEVVPPAVLVNGELVEPEDGVLLTPEEVIKALESVGAVKRSGYDIKTRLESLYEELLGS